MVDINLFDESDEEEQESEQSKNEESWEPDDSELSIGDDDVFGGDDVFSSDDDLNFGKDDSDDESDLDSDPLSSEDESIPDFDEPEDELADEDYAFGEVKKKKTSPVLVLVVLLLLAVVALDYLNIFDLGFVGPKKTTLPKIKPTPSVVTPKPVQQTPGQTTPTVQDTHAIQGKSKKTTPVTTPTTLSQTPPVTTPPVHPITPDGSITALITSAKSVFHSLASKGQLGVVIIEDKHFMVQYVSAQQGQSDLIGNEIRSLLNATQYSIAPEDQHRTGDKMYYWGVISGDLPYAVSDRPPSTSGVTNLDALIAQIKTNAQSKGLSSRDVRKFPRRFEQGQQQHPGHLVVEGVQANMVSFMDVLPTIPGPWGLSRVMITPQKQSDFAGTSLKLDLEFWVSEQ